MTMRRIDELSGHALRWAVSKALGTEFTWEDHPRHELTHCAYECDWALAGPIIERERITLAYCLDGECWHAIANFAADTSGPTPIVAAMRCFARARLGRVVDVPDELLAGC